MTSYPPPNMQHHESEFLEFRQRLKESIRNKTQNGNAIAPTSEEQRNIKIPYNDFGSFFGPSQPVIARRVLQESKSLFENELLAAKMINSIQTKKGSGPTSGSANEQKKRKAEILKDSRDYSFLLSDDAELPVSLKERNDPVPNSRPSFWENQMDHSRPDSSGSQMRSRPVPARKPVDHRVKLTQRPLSLSKPKPLTSDPKHQRVEQRKVSQELTSSQMVPRQPQVISKPPLKKPHQLHTKKKKKKTAKKSEEDALALRMITEMCKTDRYAGRDFEDYDDRGMEANFEDIIKEEKRSEKLARKEDAEQLRLIEEENRRERVREEKKQKLSH